LILLDCSGVEPQHLSSDAPVCGPVHPLDDVAKATRTNWVAGKQVITYL
jgi:hypothetical protein